MKRLRATGVLGLCVALAGAPSLAQDLSNAKPLTETGDLAAKMVQGIDAYLTRETTASAHKRMSLWMGQPEPVRPKVGIAEIHRIDLQQLIGLVDPRASPDMRIESPVGKPGKAIAEAKGYIIHNVRWPVLNRVDGEGLLLSPRGKPTAFVVALPDCDWTPEAVAGLTPDLPKPYQFARRLVENGCQVLVPVLIDRRDTWSGVPSIRMTNQPHREYLWRAAYELGRTPIGFEVQKVMAGIDWFLKSSPSANKTKIGVYGYGEGGLIAFYTAACDTRIDSAAVSGYFGPRENLWREPIYRNVFGLLNEFGDAEIAALITPRTLVIEESEQPNIKSPPPPHDGRSGAAPGEIVSPSADSVSAELRRVGLLSSQKSRLPIVVSGPTASESTLSEFLNSLGQQYKPIESTVAPRVTGTLADSDTRMKRQFDQLMEYTQKLMRESPNVRKLDWQAANSSSVVKWQETTKDYRERFGYGVIGNLPPVTATMNPQARLIYDTPKFRGYEVVLDVLPDVFAYGILLVPKDIKPGEQRPVVVCQHGLEGRPQDVANPAVDHPAYHKFACQLADRGFITFAPQNPYIGENKFRQVLRKAQPLGLTLFSFILRQHEQILNWLETLPYVDPKRIAFYGLSYGGKTAMRIPAVLQRYCLSICSGDFNEWIWKCVSTDSPYSYLLTGEYDMPEWNLANTFNYAEMSGLIAPRPFMVERGHNDGVAPDEWVAYEYAKTRRLYDKLGIGDRTEIEFFNGPHTIHGVGTFDFLHRHLNWPKPPDAK